MMIRFLKRGSCGILFYRSTGVAGNGSRPRHRMGPGTSLPTMPGYQGHELAENMVVPEFAVGDHYTTSMVMLNMGNMTTDAMADVPIPPAHRNYILLSSGRHSLPGQHQRRKRRLELTPSRWAPRSRLSSHMTAPGGDSSGWALIQVDDSGAISWGMMNGQQMMRANRIMATVYYTYKESGQVVSRAGVIPSIYQTQRYSTSLSSVQVQNGMNTALAIVNAGAQDATLQLTLWSVSGNKVATRQLVLPAGNQIGQFIDEARLFGGMFTAPFSGFVQIDSSNEGVVTLGVLLAGGIMTSMPTQHYGPVTMF